MATGIKFSEFTKVTNPNGFQVVGLSAGKNSVIDVSLIGGGGNGVQYDVDGISISTKVDGAFRIPMNDTPMDIAKVVSAAGELTRIIDVAEGTDVGGMEIKFDTTKIPSSSIGREYYLDLNFNNWEKWDELVVISGFKIPPGYPSEIVSKIITAIFITKNNMSSIEVIYLGPNTSIADIEIYFNAPVINSPISGWNLDKVTIDIGTRFNIQQVRYYDNINNPQYTPDIDTINEFFNSLNIGDVTIGYPESSRLEIGNFGAPTKFLVPQNERLLVRYPDTSERTIAYTSDIPAQPTFNTSVIVDGVYSLSQERILYEDTYIRINKVPNAFNISVQNKTGANAVGPVLFSKTGSVDSSGLPSVTVTSNPSAAGLPANGTFTPSATAGISGSGLTYSENTFTFDMPVDSTTVRYTVKYDLYPSRKTSNATTMDDMLVHLSVGNYVI
jgi:hypothetical protein